MYKTETTYTDLEKQFITAIRTQLSGLKGEISERNNRIQERDSYIYGNLLEQSLKIPIGHDKTPVNWLRRSVEIHKTQFMGRPFQVISTYDTKDIDSAEDEEDKGRLSIENSRQKDFAELRKDVIDDIIRDNGGHGLFMEGAESASAIGDWIVKCWYDKDNQKYVISPIEAVENCYVLWSKDDFRSFDGFAYVYQISKQKAVDDYNVPETVVTSVQGKPLDFIGDQTSNGTSTREMVTVMEYTGKVEGWGSEKGKIKSVKFGNENELNVVVVGEEIRKLIDDDKSLPRHYIFPNKKQRRRPWGVSDISDAAININATYVETLSDWRTVSAKVNFPKYKGFNFGPDVQMPKYKSRQVQILPLAEGQDITALDQGDSNQIDFRAQLDELKEQFVRETGISRVLFDDPSITLNSNQALLTSMKPTSDIAETKKQLWGPILQQMFTDAITILGQHREDMKEIADTEEPWELKIQYPSVMQKEDPLYQQMLLNRFNAKTISLQSYLEAQGETKEEIDRFRDEMTDPVTAAILGNQVPLMAQNLIAPPQAPAPEEPRVSVSLRGDLTPQQEAEIAMQKGFNSTGEMGPQGISGLQAQENQGNEGFLSGEGQTLQPQFGTLPQPGAQPQISTPGSPEGTGVTSQPGSGAAPTSPQGALTQANQQAGG